MHVSRLPVNPLSAAAVTIGSFDGVHLGHQKIVSRLTRYAQLHGIKSVVVTFEPQPKEHINPATAPARLSSLADKARRLKALGVDHLVVLPFNESLRTLTADEFVRQILIKRLNTQWLQVGDDFRFGADRKGDSQFLTQYDFDVYEMTSHCAKDGGRISSTRIRDALSQADFKLAEEMLGEPYSLSGRVIYGRQIGRTIGVPTANMLLSHSKLATQGVFAVQTTIDGKSYQGVANLGPKPTVGDTRNWLESHLFDFNGEIYGARITVALVKRLRGVQTFDNLDALKQQIQNDIDAAKAYFSQPTEVNLTND
ncbi:bifunctional riboflavin kinase/FAD synthetase [Reinekea marina]|uniref:Riboflavin biosynthesis protein n=1 Tax=Reinekea marina TaxID=1310421 RepID=A0ABV7WRD8_9GAMM|nr:bifunctional riboflavin kinase/FAD synthetase [Reinekea marina]MDN3648260.1 bifunctional riboflavin kinase/FAD synthetase [Reinekea marina]